MAGYSDIEALLRWDSGCDIAETRYAWLRAHPRYAETVRLHTARMLKVCEGDPLLDGILKDAGRTAAAMFAAYLHFSGGLTLPRIKALCVSLGLVSVGRARALLLYLRYLGFVETVGDRQAREPARYQATPRFMDAWRRLEGAVMESLCTLEPAMAWLADHIESPAVLARFTCAQCESFLSTAKRVSSDTPYYRIVMHSHAGTQVINTLLAANEGAFPPNAPIAFSISTAAKRFKVSRVHIGRLLAKAEKAGLLTQLEGGAIRFEPAGRSALDDVFAMQFVHYLNAAAQTAKELREQEGETRAVSPLHDTHLGFGLTA